MNSLHPPLPDGIKAWPTAELGEKGPPGVEPGIHLSMDRDTFTGVAQPRNLWPWLHTKVLHRERTRREEA